MERSPAVRRAAVLLAVEGAAIALLGAGGAVFAEADDRPAALGLAGVAVLVGGLLGVLAWAVDRMHSWARTPAIVLQLLAFPVGTDQARSGVWIAAVPVLLLAGATLYHLIVGRAAAD